MEAKQEGKKITRFLVLNPGKNRAPAGWPKTLRLVRATPWADFAVIGAQL